MMRRLGTWPITLRIAVAIAALMILLGVVASQRVLSRLGHLQDARLQEFAQLHLQGLSVALGPAARHKDVWEVYDTLDRARRASEGNRIMFTVVADEAGRVLAATDPLRAPLDSRIENYAAGALPLEDLTSRHGELSVKVGAPLAVEGRRVGQIVTELDVSDLIAQRHAATLALLAGNAAATCIVVLAGYLVVARMLKPIELLAGHMGNLRGTPRPIPEAAIPGNAGLSARLLRNFNAMTGAIEAKAEAERRLAERERFVSLGRLSSSLAHEINNPLGGLLNATDTIRNYADRPDVVRQSAALIGRGLRHMRDVSRAILEENRLDRSGLPLSSDDLDDLHVLFEPEVARRQQKLDWGNGVEELSLQNYPSGPIRQIALNLLLNASAAAPVGGVVGFALSGGDDGLELTVSDNGPGLSQADLQRLNTSAPVAPGGGVGLRLIRDLVAGLNGEIAYERSGGRTQIRVAFPAMQATPC